MIPHLGEIYGIITTKYTKCIKLQLNKNYILSKGTGLNRDNKDGMIYSYIERKMIHPGYIPEVKKANKVENKG